MESGLGYPFVHSPSSMHGAFGLRSPQGGCMLNFVIISLSSGFVSCGISAETTVSKSSGVLSLDPGARVMRICACGRPRF